jgi:hypothetical protein
MKTPKGEIAFFGPLLVVRGYPDAHDLYTDLSAFFAALRQVKTNSIGRKYPETTVSEARQVIELFSDRAKRADTDAALVRDAIEGWRAFVTTHAAVIAHRDLDLQDVYPENDRLWTHELRRLAIRLSAERETRPEDKTLVGSFVDSATALPGRISDVVSGGSDRVSEAADTIADRVGDAVAVVEDALKDAAHFAKEQLPRLPPLLDPTKWFAELKWPLIVGAGVLGGVVLLPYLSNRRAAP